jgi:hypothetical protein
MKATIMTSAWILAAAALAQTGGTADWKPFTSAKGKFTVSLPAKPSEKKRVLAISGKTVDLVSSTARKGLATYTTAYAELAGADSAAAIKVAQDDLLAQARGELKEDKEITLGESAGKELTIEIPKKVVAGGAIETARIYVVGGRLYEVISVVPTSKVDALASEVSTYFDSFKPAGGDVAQATTRPAAARAKAATPKGATEAPNAAVPPPENPGAAVIGGLNALNPFKGSAMPKGNTTAKPAEEAAPIKVTAPDGSFSVTSPAKLIVQKMDAPPGAPRGMKMDATLYQAFQGSKIFTILVTNLPEQAALGAQGHMLLTGVRDSALRASGGQLIRSKITPRDGLEGIEFAFTSAKIEPPRGGVAVNLVFFDIPAKKLYVVSVTGPAGTEDDKTVREFLDTFHFKGGK